MSKYKENQQNKEKSRAQKTAQAYYARKDIQKAIYDFCKNRETIANYDNKFFGKRPDCLDYASDIFNIVKQGATSFHCSEEIWQNPLEISTDMTIEQYNEVRTGWDFLIDIDSKYFDFSKIAAKLIIQVLEYHGVNNIGIKFSGSKGLHIIIPWKSFPEQIGTQDNIILVKDKFPEYPRMIAQYINELIHDNLINEILKLSNLEDLEKQGKKIYKTIYKPTGEEATQKKITIYKCPNKVCRTEMQSTTKSNRKTLRCPSCNGDMQKTSEKIIYFSRDGNDTSEKSPEKFERQASANELIDSVDIVLVAPRHLFRAPYSLHEKTCLASIVINKEDIDNFKPTDADPLKAEPKPFIPKEGEGEARELLLQAIDWQKKKPEQKKKFTGKQINVNNLQITEDMYPNCIKKILKGVKQDGRKRALFILMSFFFSLNFPKEYVEEKIDEWNKKNYKPLKTGYIQSQLTWFARNKIMPPNCDKHYYKELNVDCSQCLKQGIKNPINYTIKQALRTSGKHTRKQNSK